MTASVNAGFLSTGAPSNFGPSANEVEDPVWMEPAKSLFSIVILVTTLTVYKSSMFGVYKKWLLDCLETSIHFNLILLASATLYVMNTNGDQAALANVSLSIVFLTFILVIGYHIVILTPGDNLRKMFSGIKLKNNQSDTLINNDYREAESLELFEHGNDDIHNSKQSDVEYVGTTTDSDKLTILSTSTY